MDKIQVVLRETTENGRLYYRYDPEVEDDLIYIKGKITRQSDYSIIVSDIIILDIDSELTLESVEFMIPPLYWVVSSSVTPIHISRLANIGFESFEKITASEKLGLAHHKVAHVTLPIITKTDSLRSYVYFMLDEQISNDSIWIGLSEKCAALIDGDCLKGFFIDRRPMNS